MSCHKSFRYFDSSLENQISDWSGMVSVYALVIKFKEILLSKINQRGIIRKVKSVTLLNISLLQETKTMLIKMVHQWSFKDEFRWLRSVKNSNDLNKPLNKRSKISHLDPFLDEDKEKNVKRKTGKIILKKCVQASNIVPKGWKNHGLTNKAVSQTTCS